MFRLAPVLAVVALLSACAHAPSTYTPGVSRMGGRWLSIVELPPDSRQALESQLERKFGGLIACTRDAESVELAAYFVRVDLAADGRHDGELVIPGGHPNMAPAVEVCVRNRIRRWHFDPIALPGAGVTVMIPLRLYGDTYDMSRDLL